jgi:hypothetical protein
MRRVRLLSPMSTVIGFNAESQEKQNQHGDHKQEKTLGDYLEV